MNELLERLAALEHEQWMAWSKNITQTECLTNERLSRWGKLWKSYDKLTEEEKEQDRIWARKVMAIIINILENEEK